MTVDNQQPEYFSIFIEDKEEVLNVMRAKAKEDDPDTLQFLFDDDDVKSYEYCETYFDGNDCCLHTSFGTQGPNGANTVSINLKITDEILIDILTHTIRRFNKFKSAVEALK